MPILSRLALLFVLLPYASVLRVAAQTYPQGEPPQQTMQKGSSVPRLVRFSDTLRNGRELPHRGIHTITFALYEHEEGGTPLWLETQNVEVDETGSYTVLLGASDPAGLPVGLFEQGGARWLGIRVASSREMERPRILLASVPFAIKALDAATLEGRALTDFVLRDQLNMPPAKEAQGVDGAPGRVLWPSSPQSAPQFKATSSFGPGFVADAMMGPPLQVNSQDLVTNLNADLFDGYDSSVFQRRVTGACPPGMFMNSINTDGTANCSVSLGTVSLIGSGAGLSGGPITSNGTLSLDVGYTDQRYLRLTGGQLSGSLNVVRLELGALGNATPALDFESGPLDFTTSVFDSARNIPLSHLFRWQAEPLDNSVGQPSARLSLLTGTDGGPPTHTGLAINSDGTISFAPGQTFPVGVPGGDITSVQAGTGLVGGGFIGDVTLNLDTTFADSRYAQLQGPVVFTGDIHINGNLTTDRLNDTVFVGTTGGIVPAPATPPRIAIESLNGGGINDGIYYFKVTLVNWNGETTASPSQAITLANCGSGTQCSVRVQIAGHEWREGAPAFRVYASLDNNNFYRQRGFPEQLDTLGPLADAHYSAGDVILKTLTFSGPPPSATNSASIDADQVALNRVCNSAAGFPRCYGTVRYDANYLVGHSVVGTTPLVVAYPAVIEGHGASGYDDVNSGSSRVCPFAHAKLGCIMTMNTSGVRIRGVHVRSQSNGYMVLHTNGYLGAGGSNIEIGDATVSTTGTLLVAPLRIRGVFYYLRFPNLQLAANSSTPGGAGVLISNASGADWLFSGPVRWTVADRHDAIRNESGHTDADRGLSTAFPTMVGKFRIQDVVIQSGPTGSGQGTIIRGGDLVLNISNLTWSDYNPAPGTGPLIEIGASSSAAGVCCTDMYIRDSILFGAPNAASTIKYTQANAHIGSVHISNSYIAGSSSTSIALDMNNIAVHTYVDGERAMNCNPYATLHRIANVPAQASLQCVGHSAYAGPEGTVANSRLTGGVGFFSNSDSTRSRQWYWSGNDTLEFTAGDPSVSANKIIQYGGKRNGWWNSVGNSFLLDIDARGGMDMLRVGGPLVPAVTGMPLGMGANRWAANLSSIDLSGQLLSRVAPGIPPLVISSATEVPNLNAQRWHGKDASDFSAALDFAPIPAQTCAIMSLSVANATVGNAVMPAWPATLELSLVGMMFVGSNGSLTVRLCNVSGSTVDPTSQTFGGRLAN